MTEEEKNIYNILWYLNEYPHEINATDETIKNSLKLTWGEYQKAKNGLILGGAIEKRIDNKNNEAWKLTDSGKALFRKKRDELKEKNPEALEKTDNLNEVLVELHKSQIALNKAQTSSYKSENMRTGIVGLLSIIGVIVGAMIPYILPKKTEEKKEVIQTNIHVLSISPDSLNAKVDTVIVRTDTIKVK